jgi:hypothetical protein
MTSKLREDFLPVQAGAKFLATGGTFVLNRRMVRFSLRSFAALIFLGAGIAIAEPPLVSPTDKAAGEVADAANAFLGSLGEAQRAVLRELRGQYIGRHREEVSAADWEKIEEAGFGKIRFGWAGDTSPGKAYCYRVQGPTFLLERANSRNNANHLHSVWRDPEGDFGRDALADHCRHGHEH